MSERWKFQAPFTARFVGPSACGKTTLLKQVIEQKLISPWPDKIIFFYGSKWQSHLFDDLRAKHNIEFVSGFDDSLVTQSDGSSNSESSKQHKLLIFDDLVLEMKDSSSAALLFTRGSHHENISVISIEQTLFAKGKASTIMKTNCQYTVLFKSPADALSISTFSKHMFPTGRGRFLLEAYHDCTLQPFTYLIIDCKQSTPDAIRLVTKIHEPDPLIYATNAKDAEKAIQQFNEGHETFGSETKNSDQSKQEVCSLFH